MKPIKFDLQMKGNKITNYEELQEHFSADILPIFQSGRLAKWFKSRDLHDQALAIETVDKSGSELQQLSALCQVLELEADEDILQSLLEERQTATTRQTPDVSEGDKPPVEPTKKYKSFDSILCEFESALNDESTFYCGWKLIGFNNPVQKKLRNAEISYAHPDRYVDEEDCFKMCSAGSPIAFIDLTIFGSGSEGIYITDRDLYARSPSSSDERFSIGLKDITSIDLNEDRKEITFNHEFCIPYFYGAHTEKMKIVVDCLKAYTKQFKGQPEAHFEQPGKKFSFDFPKILRMIQHNVTA